MKGKIFNAQEVQSILNGSKVMFREVIKPRPEEIKPYGDGRFLAMSKDSKLYYAESPYQVGQKIFCKEKFGEVEVGAGFGYNSGKQTLYRADDDYVVDWKPAQHMRQEHSRLTLQIKSIGVERLGDISEEDAIAEGFFLDRCECLPRRKDKSPIDAMFTQRYCHKHGEEFKRFWNRTHKKPEEKFEASPWVWVVEMGVVK